MAEPGASRPPAGRLSGRRAPETEEPPPRSTKPPLARSWDMAKGKESTTERTHCWALCLAANGAEFRNPTQLEWYYSALHNTIG